MTLVEHRTTHSSCLSNNLFVWHGFILIVWHVYGESASRLEFNHMMSLIRQRKINWEWFNYHSAVGQNWSHSRSDNQIIINFNFDGSLILKTFLTIVIKNPLTYPWALKSSSVLWEERRKKDERFKIKKMGTLFW